MIRYLVSSLLLLSLWNCGGESADAAKGEQASSPVQQTSTKQVETAVPQLTGTPITAFADSDEIIIEESAPGFCSVNGYIESEHAGFTGSGYSNTVNETNAQITWQVNATTAGTYRIELVYAATTDRPVTVTSNNSSVTMNLPSSNGWNIWASEVADISLAEGNNDIVLSANTGSGAPNIDSLSITGDGISPSDCSSTPVDPGEITLEELELGFCSIDGAVEAEHSGFNGAGYANTTNNTNTQIRWKVNATTAGTYDIELVYAATTDRPVTITSNDTNSIIDFPSSTAWDVWASNESEISLIAGENDIILSANTLAGAPNIDSLRIIGDGLSAGDCIYSIPTPPSTDTQVFVIGDSTVANYNSSSYPQRGWGQVLKYFFDEANVGILNRARGGRSSRSFYTEVGLWNDVINEIGSGDYLLIQFGHNDRDFTKEERYTPPEDFETYLSLYVAEARAKGATPILISPMVMNAYRDGVLRNVFTEGGNDYRGAMANVASALNVAFVDLNMKSYDLVKSLGVEQATHYLYFTLNPGEYPNFPNGNTDGTHFQESGAVEMARLIAEGIQELSQRADVERLAAQLETRYALTVESEGANGSIITTGQHYPKDTPITVKTIAGASDTFNAWYHLGEKVSDTNIDQSTIYQSTMPASTYTLTAAFNNAVPVHNFDPVTVYLIGDSTVSNYTSGYYPQTGWGQVFQHFFNHSRVTIDNRALGGRSSKSFYENHWNDVKADIDAGDFVFIQFGINDRSSDEDRAAPTGGVFEGFMTSFANETHALGAIPVFVSTVRRNNWQNGVPYNAYHGHPVVTRELAATLGVALIDLDGKNKALLESVGQDYANKFYYMGFGPNEYANYASGKNDTVHFQEAGAVEIARLAREGITELSHYDTLAPLNRALKPLHPLDITSPTPQAGVFTKGFSYPAGAPLTLKALPHSGNVFTQWLDENRTQTSANALFLFTADDEATQYSAVFNNSEGLEN